MNTLENKAKFFAQYYNQYVLYFTQSFLRKVDHLILSHVEDSDYLELKPLSSITDEDAEFIGLDTHYNKTESVYKNAEDFLIITDYFGFLTQFESDYLRSKGYAVPFMGLSVEELESFGWIKLKSD